MTYFSCTPEYSSAESRTRAWKSTAGRSRRRASPAELEQAKNKINSRVVLSSERPRGRLFNVGSNWTYRHEYRSVKDDLDAVDAVTLNDLAAVLRKYPLTAAPR